MDGDEEEKKDKKEDEDKGPNGCLVCLEATWAGSKAGYYVIKWIIMTICGGISYCWYPMKERCVSCCNRCSVER